MASHTPAVERAPDVQLALIVEALKNLGVDVNASAAGTAIAAGDHTSTSSSAVIPAPLASLAAGSAQNGAPQAAPMTLSSLIQALGLLGINVISPLEEITREEEEQALQDANAQALQVANNLAAQRAHIFAQKPGISPWIAGAIPPVAGAHSGASQAAVIAASLMAPAAPVAPAAPAANLEASANHESMAPTANPEPAVAASDSTLPEPNLPAGVSGFVCTACHHYNTLKTAGDTYYCIIAGRSVGVYKGWHNVQPLVSGVGHACYKKYPSEAEAMAAFEEAQNAGYVIVLA